jgi:hypothetical protein
MAPCSTVHKRETKPVIGGAHQQTSERAAPPVSVEEKGKTTGDNKENCYYFCVWAYKIKTIFFYVVRRAPEHY